jgi:hypothetical protein
MINFEKLGAFYLGRVVDPVTSARTDEPLLYDARDLTTHAVCVGMTGSGKTGLCLALLEEAAIDGIPAIAIDPKGDLGNLLLTFPGLRPEDFRPWIDAGEAARAGLDIDTLAARTAESWRQGLAEWGQEPARIARLRAAAEFAIYTPGSTAGRPLSVLRSLAAPPAEERGASDLMRERIGSTVAGLLALVGIETDPLRGREPILLATLVEQAWREGRDVALGDLVRLVQTPPCERIGVMDLESFYPAKDRATLAVALNGLIASPGFGAWLEGDPLDARRLLYTADGRPRVAIVSIAHLSEPERMFLVTLLLSEVLAWARTQAGTSSLRAILYMDEIAGYAPPIAAPPSKAPLLTLMKQARAYGLGVVLATQNPVDLDYKGLANAGTWFLGRLQTERDKLRVLDGLEGATAASGSAFDRSRADTLLSGLRSRRFLMANAHEETPVLFESRWALSYLRGPMTRPQIQALMATAPVTGAGAAPPTAGATAAGASAPAVPVTAAAAPPTASSAADAGGPSADRPVLPADVPEYFLAGGVAVTAAVCRLAPALLGTARLHYVDTKSGVDLWEKAVVRAALPGSLPASIWEKAEIIGAEEPSLSKNPPAGARFAPLPAAAARPKSYAAWEKDLAGHLYQRRALALPRCPELKLVGRPGESAGDFRIRVRDAARARRDAAVETMRARYAPKVRVLQDKLRRAEERVEREQSQFNAQTVQTAISVGATVLGALFGRKATGVGSLGRATTAMRGAGRSAREHADIGQAQESVAALRQQLQDLETEARAEIAGMQNAGDPAIETTEVRPRKSDIAIDRVALVWMPAS